MSGAYMVETEMLTAQPSRAPRSAVKGGNGYPMLDARKKGKKKKSKRAATEAGNGSRSGSGTPSNLGATRRAAEAAQLEQRRSPGFRATVVTRSPMGIGAHRGNPNAGSPHFGAATPAASHVPGTGVPSVNRSPMREPNTPGSPTGSPSLPAHAGLGRHHGHGGGGVASPRAAAAPPSSSSPVAGWLSGDASAAVSPRRRHRRGDPSPELVPGVHVPAGVNSHEYPEDHVPLSTALARVNSTTARRANPNLSIDAASSSSFSAGGLDLEPPSSPVSHAVLSVRCADLERLVRRERAQRETAEASAMSLRTQLATADARARSLAESAARAEGSAADADRSRSEASRQAEVVAALRGDLSGVRDELARSSADLRAQIEKRRAADASTAALASEVAALKAEVEVARGEARAAQVDLSSARADAANASRRGEDAVRDARRHGYEECAAELRAAQRDRRDALSELERLRAESIDSATVALLRAELREKERILAVAGGTAGSSAVELATARDAAASAEERAKALAAALEAMRTEGAASLEREKAECRAARDAAAAEAAELRGRVSVSRAEIESLRSDLAAARAEAGSLRESEAVLRAAASDAGSRAHSVRVEESLRNTEAELSVQRSAAERAAAEVGDLSREAARLREENARLREIHDIAGGRGVDTAGADASADADAGAGAGAGAGAASSRANASRIAGAATRSEGSPSRGSRFRGESPALQLYENARRDNENLKSELREVRAQLRATEEALRTSENELHLSRRPAGERASGGTVPPVPVPVPVPVPSRFGAGEDEDEETGPVSPRLGGGGTSRARRLILDSDGRGGENRRDEGGSRTSPSGHGRRRRSSKSPMRRLVDNRRVPSSPPSEPRPDGGDWRQETVRLILAAAHSTDAVRTASLERTVRAMARSTKPGDPAPRADTVKRLCAGRIRTVQERWSERSGDYVKQAKQGGIGGQDAGVVVEQLTRMITSCAELRGDLNDILALSHADTEEKLNRGRNDEPAEDSNDSSWFSFLG